ncbi:hypothetical protein DFH08DRAFT_978201 [Mycena albidolilacea]|uniref:Uncharacterized protein n=1 Tax=Mycena albidolilacea TaxID=1033008 RepID=A0AAD6YZ38_9AGAR|nr:hypothetical protein DFH08DRAFT_978201 [Mycena albidolilacea]
MLDLRDSTYFPRAVDLAEVRNNEHHTIRFFTGPMTEPEQSIYRTMRSDKKIHWCFTVTPSPYSKTSLRRSSGSAGIWKPTKSSGTTLAVLQSLRLIPTLTRFETCFPKSELLAAVFAALANSHSLLPNLRTLIIHLSKISEYAWREALRAASTRRSIHFDIFPVRPNPPEDVLAGFRELVSDGVRIQVTGEAILTGLVDLKEKL